MSLNGLTLNPYSKITKQQVLGYLKSTNSKDEDVLHAKKEELLTLAKLPKTMSYFGIGIGALLTITVIAALAGIPMILAGFWARNRGVNNISMVNETFNEYLNSIQI